MPKNFERVTDHNSQPGAERFGPEWNAPAKALVYARAAGWFMRGLAWRFFFKTVKGRMLIGKQVTIRNPGHLKVGADFIAETGCEISCFSRRGIELGNKVTVGSYAIIRPSTLWGGTPGEGLKVGDNSNIGPFSYIGCSGYIEIGCNVMISPRVSIYSENHCFDDVHRLMKHQGVARQFVKIEDDCWIAANSVILAGVTIGTGSVVAAGSVVTKDVPPYSVVAGAPAKVINRRK